MASKDIIINVTRYGVNARCYVEVVHRPTGTMASASSYSQLVAQHEAMKALREKMT